jgi:hypothetical protein
MLGAGGFDLSDVQMEAIVASSACQQSLTHIGIGGCSNLTQAALQSIGRHCSETLTSLNAHNLHGINEDVVHQLQGQCGGRLRSLDLTGVKDRAHQPIEDAFASFPYVSDDMPPPSRLHDNV